MTLHHLHLALTHIPLMAVLFALPILLFGLLTGRRQVQLVGLALAVLGGLSAVAVSLTGEAAEEAIERLPGVAEAVLERHEETAGFFLVLVLLLAAAALFACFLRPERWRRWSAWGVVVLATLTLAVGMVVASSGGAIRRPELRGGALADGAAAMPASYHEDDDDD